MEQEEIDKQIKFIKEVIQQGYAGTLSSGELVDRREHPEAIPIQKNTLLGTPKPKEIKSGG